MSTILPEVAPEHVAPAAVTEQTAPPVSPAVTDVTVTQPEPAPEPAATPAPAEPTDTNVSIAEPEQPAPVPDPTVTTTTASTDTAAPLGTDSEPTAHITPDARSNLIEQVGLLPRYEARSTRSVLTCAHIHVDLPKGRGGQRAPRSRAASLRGGAVTTKHREPYVPEQHHDGGHGRGCSGDRWERPGARQEAGEHLGVEIWPGMFQSSPPRPSSPSLSTSPVYGLSSIPVPLPIFPPLYAGEQLAGKEYTHGGRASRQCRYAERGDARIRRPMSVCGRCASVFDNRSLLRRVVLGLCVAAVLEGSLRLASALWRICIWLCPSHLRSSQRISRASRTATCRGRDARGVMLPPQTRVNPHRAGLLCSRFASGLHLEWARRGFPRMGVLLNFSWTELLFGLRLSGRTCDLRVCHRSLPLVTASWTSWTMLTRPVIFAGCRSRGHGHPRYPEQAPLTQELAHHQRRQQRRLLQGAEVCRERGLVRLRYAGDPAARGGPRRRTGDADGDHRRACLTREGYGADNRSPTFSRTHTLTRHSRGAERARHRSVGEGDHNRSGASRRGGGGER